MARYHDDPSLRDRAPVFRDRAEAGQCLARLLKDFRGSGALVAAIPAGGVPVAAEIAKLLELELDVFPVSKILLPWNTESGFGAVAFDGSVWINEPAVLGFGLSADAVQRSTTQARSKVERRLTLLRGHRPLPELHQRSVILVDDGVAAGSTVRAAVTAVRKLGADKIIVAVPTGHASSVEVLSGIADQIWCANVRGGASFAVADAYECWYDVNETEIKSLIRSAAESQ